jgi:hypothetical protein
MIDLKCKKACQTCSEFYPTANLFIQHKCFKTAPVYKQKEQLDLFRRKCESKLGLIPRNRHRTGHSSSLGAVNSGVPTTQPLPTSVEATDQGGLSNNATLPHISGLSVLHESDQFGALTGVNDISMFNPPDHMWSRYVTLTQPQVHPHRDWNSSDFPNEDGFL